LMKMIINIKKLKPSLILLDLYSWRWGVKKYADLYGVMKEFKFDPAKITCPLLSIIGEKEYNNGPASRSAQDEAIRLNPSDKSKVIITKASEGGDAHAMATNMSLMAQLVFDWLDEVLADA